MWAARAESPSIWASASPATPPPSASAARGGCCGRCPPRRTPGPEFWTASYRRLRLDDRDRAVPARPFWNAWRGPEQAAHRRWAGGLAAVAALAALVAGPLQHSVVVPVSTPPVVAPAAQDVSPDVSSLVESHTESVSRLPLGDPDRQKMLAADARQAPLEASEAAGYADIAF